MWETSNIRNNSNLFSKLKERNFSSQTNQSISSILNKTNSFKLQQEFIKKHLEKTNETKKNLTEVLDKLNYGNSKKNQVLNLIEEIISLLKGKSSLLREKTIISLNSIKDNIEFENLKIRLKELKELKSSIVKDKKEDVVDLTSCINAFKNL